MSEGESRERLRSLVGIYNFTWAAASGLAYATSGAMRTSFGPRSMFYAPLVLLALEMFLSIWLERQVNNQPSVASNNPSPRMAPTAELRHSQVPPATFLKMAWLANPMAYLAINTIVATIPTLVLHFHLTQTLAVVVCSVWLFTRAGAFMLLWFWSGWHYRFRFLAGAFAAMVVSFGSMLLATTLWMLVLSQAVLGFSFALMYYSALFYSMDVGETKGEHSGIHEAVIGAGNCSGPAIAAAALLLFPEHPASGTLAVCLLLACALAVLFWLRFKPAATQSRS
jgi:hypothetical protein